MNTHRLHHSKVINDRRPLRLKSHWGESGSPNTRNSSQERPVKLNDYTLAGRTEGGSLRTEVREEAPKEYVIQFAHFIILFII